MNIFAGICSDQSRAIFQLGKATDDGIAIEFSPRASTWILITYGHRQNYGKKKRLT